MTVTNELREAIEQEIRSQVNRHNVNPIMSGLVDMMAYHLGWEGEGAGPAAQGKRVRSILLTLCTAASGGYWTTSLPAAASVELIHNFSLIHDDIEDQSHTRRGRPTLWTKWGIPQAINTGDAMFSLAHLAIYDLDSEIPTEIVLQCSRLLQKTCLELTHGQYLDISFEQWQDISLETYWQMITGKTAALLACCSELGALISGCSTEIVENYRLFGKNLGLAFQALDDMLGIWGDSSRTGKSVESDLTTGKKTLPVLYGLQQQGEFFKRWHNKRIEPDEVLKATQILLAEGAKGYTQDRANHFTKLALESIEVSKPIGHWADALKEFAHTLLFRSY